MRIIIEQTADQEPDAAAETRSAPTMPIVTGVSQETIKRREDVISALSEAARLFTNIQSDKLSGSFVPSGKTMVDLLKAQKNLLDRLKAIWNENLQPHLTSGLIDPILLQSFEKLKSDIAAAC